MLIYCVKLDHVLYSINYGTSAHFHIYMQEITKFINNSWSQSIQYKLTAKQMVVYPCSEFAHVVNMGKASHKTPTSRDGGVERAQ